MYCRNIAIILALVGASAHASNDKERGFVPFFTDAEWSVTQSEDPTGLAPAPMIQRFELRPGDCLSEPPFNDCEAGVERAELAEDVSAPNASSQAYWYRWKVFFPEDFEGTYPARNRHGQFNDQATGAAAWVFELGSTGALWLGSRFDDESRFFSLINERDLRGHWHDIIVEAVWSKTKGKINVWLNDERRVQYRGATCKRCRIFLSYGISRVGVDEFKKRHPERELPTQVVYYLPANVQMDDPGWIVPPPPELVEEVGVNVEMTKGDPGETADPDEGVVDEGSTSVTTTEMPEEVEENSDSAAEPNSEDTAEEVTIEPEPEPEEAEEVTEAPEAVDAESQDTDGATASSGQEVEAGQTNEDNLDEVTETDSQDSDGEAPVEPVKLDPASDLDDRR